jgi:dynein heavy chain
VQKNFLNYSEIINNTCEVANEEYKIESALEKIKKEWESLQIQTEVYKKTYKIRATEPIFSTLEEHMGTLSNQKTGVFY